jgi:hypothetical protein
LIVVLFFGLFRAYSQNYTFSDADIQKRITRDVTILSSDSLQGRESGTYGEFMARQYIASQFEEIGLKPMFINNSYFQKFTYNDNPWYGRFNRMSVNGKSLNLYTEYYALAFTGNDSISGETVSVGYGISAPDQGIDDYANLSDLKGKIFLIYTSLPEAYKKNPAVEKLSGKVDKVKLAVSKGAKAVIFLLPEGETIEPNASLAKQEVYADIPVVFLRNKAALNAGAPNQIDLSVNVIRDRDRPAYNVAGYIDNGADTWVVIGAHYDHLGWSYSEDGKPLVNNGADDNASGTASVIELARFLKQSAFKKNNYVFCAFSGEEKGLIGSTYFTNSKTIELEKVNYMLDLDMVGRLNSKKGLKIYGTGTSEVWKTVLPKSNEIGLKIKQIKAGFGGSDHMPFYYKEIPDLFLHTGLHPDYHTPADDVEKINFSGMINVIKFTEKVIENLDGAGKLIFVKASPL